ncbi:unnamed protein product [Ectocarpus sp. 4 AP-2014]
MASTDRDVLNDLFEATGGARWATNVNWGTNAPLSEWHGVEVNKKGRVVKLVLDSNCLEGVIPESLAALSELEALRLINNKLTGPIPAALRALRELRVLVLYKNQLNGCIPKELGDLSQLEHLSLSDNSLTGSIPRELGALSKLHTLQLYCNMLAGSIPKDLFTSSRLETLWLNRNKLTGPIPPEIGNATALTSVKLHRNELSGHIPKELAALRKLEVLLLANNRLTGFVPAQVVKLQSISSLDLEENLLIGPKPSAIELRMLHDSLFLRGDDDEAWSEEMVKMKKPCKSLKSAKSSIKTSILSTESTCSTDTSATSTTMSTPTSSASTSTKQEEAVVSNTVKQNKPPRIPEARAIVDHPGKDLDALINTRMAAISDFEGEVVAWCFGDGPKVKVLRNHDLDFELEVPDLGKKIPALIGLCSSSAEVVDGKQCLLHPVVRCLARNGESFDPNLRLRFPLGDEASMESGSDGASDDDDDDVAYRAYLASKFSVVTREDAGSEWVPIDGTIIQAEGGVFVLEVAVPHFCDFALSQGISVPPGCMEIVPLPKLKGKPRRSHFHFVNQGEENLVAHCWGAVKKTGFWDFFKINLGAGAASANVEFEGRRQPVDIGNGTVYSVEVPGRDPSKLEKSEVCRLFLGTEPVTVAWTSQRRPQNAGHRIAQVWGSSPMQHKHAMVFGPLLDIDTCQVSNLRVDDDEPFGKLVKSKVE